MEQCRHHHSYIAYERDVGDIDRDGRNDVVAVMEGDTTVQVFHSPTWRRSTLITFTGDYRYPRADDFKLADIDGDLDLVSIAYDDFAKLHLWRNDSTQRGTTSPRVVTSSDSPWGVVRATLGDGPDGDGTILLENRAIRVRYAAKRFHDGNKVCLLDTDHIGWKVFIDDAAFTRAWAWKSFARGHSTLLMENLADSAGWIAGRAAMGHTRRLAERVNLAAMTPSKNLASSGYCLANPGHEYLVYLPEGGEVTVDLTVASGTIDVQWLHPVEGIITPGESIEGGTKHAFKVPFSGDAVLYLKVVP